MSICARRRMGTSVSAGEVVFTTSQTWTIPTGVKVLDMFIVAGGCSGAGGIYANSTEVVAGGGGGGGNAMTILNQSVTPETTLSIVIGAGGKGGAVGGLLGGSSSVSSSSFTYTSDNADFGSPLNGKGGNGMSGGGGGAGSNDMVGTSGYGGDGGSNGGDGTVNKSYGLNYSLGGTGSGKTTRAFGESSKALFAGGGGGGAAENEWTSYGSMDPGAGADGGGDGGWGYGNNATANTGSGGGGGGAACYDDGGDIDPQLYNGGDGGSGIVIIRWKEQ